MTPHERRAPAHDDGDVSLADVLPDDVEAAAEDHAVLATPVSEPARWTRRRCSRCRACARGSTPAAATCTRSTASTSRSAGVRCSASSASPARARASRCCRSCGSSTSRAASCPAACASTASTSSNLRQEGAARDPRQPHLDGVPAAERQPAPVLQRRTADQRGVRDPPQLVAQGGRREGGRDAAGGRHPRPEATREVVPAPAVGRPGPARDDRDGARRRARAADRRRADHRARRHDPGPDPRPDAQAAGRARARASC